MPPSPPPPAHGYLQVTRWFAVIGRVVVGLLGVRSCFSPFFSLSKEEGGREAGRIGKNFFFSHLVPFSVFWFYLICFILFSVYCVHFLLRFPYFILVLFFPFSLAISPFLLLPSSLIFHLSRLSHISLPISFVPSSPSSPSPPSHLFPHPSPSSNYSYFRLLLFSLSFSIFYPLLLLRFPSQKMYYTAR